MRFHTRRRITPRRPPAAVQPLENRQLLSAAPAAVTTADPTTATVTATVYDDANDNGTQDAGEAGLAGATVYVDLTGADTFTAGDPSAVTNAAGAATITGVPAGMYTVRLEPPTGYTQSAPQAGNGLVENAVAGGTTFAGNFGAEPDAAVLGSVYVDANANGVDDAGDAPAAGVTVFLDLNGDGTPDAGDLTTTTLADGTYDLADVPPGSYELRVALPAGDVVTEPAGGSGYNFPVVTGQVLTGQTFGIDAATAAAAAGVITGTADLGTGPRPGATIFLDLNGDGLADDGEPTATAAADGTYTFGGLTTGSYVVRQVVPLGEAATAPAGGSATVAVTTGQTSAGPTFGASARPASGLAATVLTAPPATAIAGATRATVRVRVTNGGTAAFAGPAAVAIYASADGTVATADTPDVTVTKQLRLAAGRSAVVAVPFTFGATTASGSYKLVAAVTGPAADAPAVSAATAAVAVAAPTVVLTPTLIAPGKGLAVKLGRIERAAVRITNSGNATAVGTVVVLLYSTFSGVVDTLATGLGTLTEKVRLAPRRSTAVTIRYGTLSTALPGTYQMIAVIAPTTTPADAAASVTSSPVATREKPKNT